MYLRLQSISILADVSGFWESFAGFAELDNMRGFTYSKQVQCHHCGSETFWVFILKCFLWDYLSFNRFTYWGPFQCHRRGNRAWNHLSGLVSSLHDQNKTNSYWITFPAIYMVELTSVSALMGNDCLVKNYISNLCRCLSVWRLHLCRQETELTFSSF